MGDVDWVGDHPRDQAPLLLLRAPRAWCSTPMWPSAWARELPRGTLVEIRAPSTRCTRTTRGGPRRAARIPEILTTARRHEDRVLHEFKLAC